MVQMVIVKSNASFMISGICVQPTSIHIYTHKCRYNHCHWMQTQFRLLTALCNSAHSISKIQSLVNMFGRWVYTQTTKRFFCFFLFFFILPTRIDATFRFIRQIYNILTMLLLLLHTLENASVFADSFLHHRHFWLCLHSEMLLRCTENKLW